MDKIRYELQPFGDHMRFVAMDELIEAGEITFFEAEKTVIVIDHTFVEREYGGQGIAFQLVNHVIELAREKNKKIIPLCPYARKVFDTHDEFVDVEYKRIVR